MKRLLAIVLLAAIAIPLNEPASARPRRVVVRRGPARTRVVVHRGWPLRRPLRTVYVRPARTVVRVAPAVFLAPVVWTAVVVSAPAHDLLAWEDTQILARDDDWTEFTLNCDARGRKLYLEITGGAVQADWAEIVFENGDTQVVDFGEKTHSPGLYSLLDFKDGRKVDHVRMVARAKGDEARVTLKMEK